MMKRLYHVLLSTAACSLMSIAAFTVSTASFGFHGEPECPKELLK